MTAEKIEKHICDNPKTAAAREIKNYVNKSITALKKVKFKPDINCAAAVMFHVTISYWLL